MSFVFFIVGIVFISLPFLPAIFEAVKKTDFSPLKISRQLLKDARANPEYIFLHFAHSVGYDDIKLFQEKLEIAEPLYFNSSFLAIPGGAVDSAFPKQIARVISSKSISLPARTVFPSKILSMASIVAEEKSLFNEIHANDRLEIKRGSKLVWWASANEVVLHNDVNLPGKIQARTAILFQGSARFHYLSAPRIQSQDFILPSSFIPVLEPPAENKRRSVIFSQYELRASEVHEGDLIVKHDLLLGPNSKIYGSIKCHGNLRLSPGAQVFGNMVGQKNIEFLGENWVTGTVLGNQKIVIGNAVLIGSESRQVTCSAREIYLRGAFQVHGVLRAWRAGVILGKA